MSRLSIVQGARHRMDGTYARRCSVQEQQKDLGLVSPEERRKTMNNLYWFSSQKHQAPPWHLANLAMRVTKPWEGHHASIPAPKNLQKPSWDAAALRQGELGGIVRNLLAFLQDIPAIDPPGRHGGHKHLRLLNHPPMTAQKSPPAIESCSTSLSHLFVGCR